MLNTTRFAAVATVCLVAAGTASAATHGTAGPPVAPAGPAAGGQYHDRLAFTQRSVPVGNRSFFGQEWRCSINKGGTSFFSTAFSESQARAKLATRVAGHASCFRDRRFRFFGVD